MDCSRPGATTPTSCSTCRSTQGDDLDRRSGLRHWLVPRACGLGTAELRVRGRDRLPLRGYLPWQFGQGRAADRSRRSEDHRGALGLRRRTPCCGHHCRSSAVRSRPTDSAPNSKLTTTPDGGCWRGLDDIGLTLRHVDQIDEFERRRAEYKPKTLPAKVASPSWVLTIELFSLQHTKMCDLSDCLAA